jgi:hypothetical protein
VWFVDLSSMTDEVSAARAIARGVGATVDNDPVESAVSWASRADGVVVLDNLEQVLGASSLVRSLLDAGGSVRWMATSRRALRLREEQLVALQPLAVRDAHGAAGEATKLFRLRAALVRADLDEVDETIVTEICELTAGIPLGVELAALQLLALSPAQLLRRLHGFSSAAIDAPATDDYPERQSSLRAVLDSTVTLLSNEASVVLTHAALTDGPITIELIEASCATRGIDALGHLGDLVESGLVRRVGDRLQVPPPVRRYVATTASENELGVAQDALFAQIDALTSDAEGRWFGPDAEHWHGRLVADAAAIDAAIAGRLERGQFSELAELALRLGQYWLHESRLVDASVTLDALRAVDLEPELAHRIRLLAGTFASYVNRADTAQLLEPALRAVSARPDRLVVNAWCCLGAFHAHHHDDDETRRCVEGARATAAASGDPALVALARDFAGYAAFYLGDTDTTIRLNLEAIEDARRQVGFGAVHVSSDPPSVTFSRPGIEVSLGAVGKGYALDRARAVLRASGVQHALLSAGGSSIVALGGRGGGWVVDVVSPLRPARPIATLSLRNAALGTSGAGEQFVVQGGRRYGHVIDPRSGWPVDGTLSASVVASDAARADALSTAFLVGGLDLARRYCGEHPAVLALVTPDDGSERTIVVGGHLAARVASD